MEETDAINLLRAYVYIDSEVPGSMRLYNKLNQTVSDQALSNREDVSMTFVVKYLSTFYDLPIRRDLDQKLKSQWLELLEEKVVAQKTNFNTNFLYPLSKILVRHKDSAELRNFVITTLKGSVRSMDFKTAKLALLAIRKTDAETLAEVEKQVTIILISLNAIDCE